MREPAEAGGAGGSGLVARVDARPDETAEQLLRRASEADGRAEQLRHEAGMLDALAEGLRLLARGRA